MQSFKELINSAFFHSWQRTAMVLGGLVLAIALPITIILTQQQQDLRQRASGVTLTPEQQAKEEQDNCTYRLGSAGFLCYANTRTGGGTSGSSGNSGPIADNPVIDNSNTTTSALTSAPMINVNNYSNVTCNSITVQWSSAQPSSYITNQRLAWRTNDGTTNWQNAIDVSPRAMSYTVSNLNPNTEYFFQVGASGTNGQYLWSNISSKKTTASCQTVGQQPTTPPSCTTTITCTGSCTAPNNTCGTSNGTKSGCTYTSHPTSGNKCTPVAAPGQTCGINNCTSPNTCSNNKCVAPNATRTPTPTATVTPTPTRGKDNNNNTTPTATPTPPAGTTRIALSVSLPGIGSNQAASGSGALNNNATPKRTTRTVEVLLANSAGQNATNLATGNNQTPATGTLTFDPTTFTFKGTVNLGSLPTGSYQIFMRLDNTLYKKANGFPTITKNQTTTIPNILLISGDIDRTNNSNNDMTLDDYIMFIACYKEKAICTAEAKQRADLDDNGKIDTIDLTIMQRGFANREGDSPI